jgi:hypothetical protein
MAVGMCPGRSVACLGRLVFGVFLGLHVRSFFLMQCRRGGHQLLSSNSGTTYYNAQGGVFPLVVEFFSFPAG